MRSRTLLPIFVASLMAYTTSAQKVHVQPVHVEAPFPMDSVYLCTFPNKEFPITKYGARKGNNHLNTQAFAKAIEACNRAGGGRVVVPAGEWFTGPIHLKSHVNLFLEEGAVVRSSDNPNDYLPAVMTSWEGLECYNYSPLIYAFECENVGISGKGTLAPVMDTWRTWFKRPEAHLNALRQLYSMGSTDVPVKQRQMVKGENHLRPHLIHFNRCKNILLEDFHIRQSPFWTIHLYLCNSGVVRHLDVQAHGHNNDGIDLEMSRNFLIENCKFDQGDDAVVIKAGRNQDAWRLNTPSENIVVRDCDILNGHTLLGIGSEISGGVRNIYMTRCKAPQNVHRLFFLKTNHRRGGFIENIYLEDIEAGDMLRTFEVDTDVLYQWKDLVPTYEARITRIDGIHVKNIHCQSADAIYELKGDARLPIRNVFVENVKVDTVRQFINRLSNVENFQANEVSATILLHKETPSIDLDKLYKQKAE